MNICKLSLGLCTLALLAGCGTPGEPIPPSLELPKPVSDLTATRKGDKVYLAWSAPSETTDRHNNTHPGDTEVCRIVGMALRECGQPIAKLPPQKSPYRKNVLPKSGATYVDHLPAQLQFQNPTSNTFYAIAVLNSYGREAGLSNQVQVPAAPTLPPPTNFQAHLTAEGVQLSFIPSSAPEISGLRFVYRIYRRQQGTNKDTIAGSVPFDIATFLDQTFEWEKNYEYRATVVTYMAGANGAEQQVEGEDTPAITIVAHDVFPPATPSGLQAVFSGPGQKPFIDLVWTPNAESDLAGYNIYRHTQGASAVKVNSELVKGPAFRDSDVVPGNSYKYSVSAVDVRGNESPHCEEASESVPPE